MPPYLKSDLVTFDMWMTGPFRLVFENLSSFESFSSPLLTQLKRV